MRKMMQLSTNQLTIMSLGMLEKAGYHISFLHYLKVCFVPMLITVVLAMFSRLGFEMPR